MEPLKELPNGTMISKYQIVFLIGAGGFGHVYKVIDLDTNQSFALKTERNDVKYSFLKNEVECLANLKNPCFPCIHAQGTCEKFNYYVMNMYGLSISDICRSTKLPLSLKLPICYKMFTIIKTLHYLGFIHRDIKPSNFLIQQSATAPLVLVDFGLAVAYINPTTGLPYKFDQKSFAGTKKYLSVFSHKKKQFGRRDDLISWIYSCVEIITGSLPWTPCETETDLVYVKEVIKPDELCRNMPNAFCKIFTYLLTLSEEANPSYSSIDKDLKDAIKENNIDLKGIDWMSFYIDNVDFDGTRNSVSNFDDDNEGRGCNIY